MSQKGVQLAAKLFADMQNLRMELLGMGSAKASTPEGKADLLLGQMVETGKDAMKDAFMQITSDRYPHEEPVIKRKKTLGNKIS